jgi:hypothetical protein
MKTIAVGLSAFLFLYLLWAICFGFVPGLWEDHEKWFFIIIALTVIPISMMAYADVKTKVEIDETPDELNELIKKLKSK